MPSDVKPRHIHIYTCRNPECGRQETWTYPPWHGQGPVCSWCGSLMVGEPLEPLEIIERWRESSEAIKAQAIEAWNERADHAE